MIISAGYFWHDVVIDVARTDFDEGRRASKRPAHDSMTSRPVIFISAVSKELHSARELVFQTLVSLGFEPLS